MAPTPMLNSPVFAAENLHGKGEFLVICEHASNRFPKAFGTLGLGVAERRAHIAWDPGAVGLARALARRLDAGLIHATVSRLIYDLNRPPHAPGAMPAISEIHEIPGNAALSAADRHQRTEMVYLPFHAAVSAEIAGRLALGRPPVIVTIHSFTSVYFGKPRAVELGVIHDADPAFALNVLDAARAATDLRCELNQPYSAADSVTHTLRLHATPYGLDNVMLEIRNDLIASPDAEAAMADRLAPVLRAALGELQRGRHRRAAPAGSAGKG